MREAIYGFPPPALITATPSMRQLSPLVPGSEAIEKLEPASLSKITVLAPPGTIERRYTLALALRALVPGGHFTFLAPKDKGGSRLAKELREMGQEAEEESKAHHRILRGTRGKNLELENAIAEGAPRFDAELGLHTQPGVFSWNRVDPATALLTKSIGNLRGHGADLGGGLGLLTLAALSSPLVAGVDLFELDRRAIECARKNVSSPKARFHWMNVREGELPLSGLDFVVMNPPFHEAGDEDQSLGQDFLRQAAFILRSGGTLWLVANRHLPYEAILKSLFSKVQTRAEADGFKVIEAIR